MLGNVNTPAYFMISGFPKSGNKWLQKMVFDFESVGSYSNRPQQGVALMARMFLDHPRLQPLLTREGATLQDFTIRLVHPQSPARLKLSESGRREMMEVLRDLAIDSTKFWPADDGHDPVERFLHVIDPDHRPPFDASTWRVFGMPCMHTPLPRLEKDLPAFRVINILRDPRDVVVSFFYHLLATLSPPIAMQLVRANRSTGELEQHPNWKKMFANRARRRLLDYYGGKPHDPSRIHRVRYEDLLQDAAGQLRRILQFLGVSEFETDARIAEVVQDRSFEKATGGRTEQRHSMLRKGQAGDWANYFDRALLDALGSSFIDLVTQLGYESDDSWTHDVLHEAPKRFDFARFRIKRSTCRLFINYWEQSPELQTRYPDSWDSIEGEDCFFTWLENCDHQDVRDWLNLARRLEDLWHVDIVEKAGQ